MGRSLSPIEVKTINEIITEREWNDHLWGKPIFDRIAEMVGSLEKKERSLVIKLLEDYLIVKDSQYVPRIEYATKLIDDSYLLDRKDIFMLPLLKEEDIGKVKSSTSIMYDVKRTSSRNGIFTGYRGPVLYDRLDMFAEEEDDRSNALIILCDDFVGSGTTAEDAINYFELNYSIDSDRIIVFCLITLKQGLKRIRDNGYKVVFDSVLSKGISKSRRFSDPDSALKKMDQIEGRIGVSKEYGRGYKESEGLVTLKRTPNNTFPVFWYNGQSNWPAAFPR